MGEYDPADFETLYPGVYTAREADLVAQQLARSQALEERGPVDATALAAGTLSPDTPGVGPTLPVTEAMVRYNNAKYDPDNRLLNDAGLRTVARLQGHPGHALLRRSRRHLHGALSPRSAGHPPGLSAQPQRHQLRARVSRRHSLPGHRPALAWSTAPPPRAPSTAT